MTKRTVVTFQADFADESKWAGSGDLLVPDGRSISKTLVDAMGSEGLCPTDASQYSFYGWAFEVVFPKRKVWCLLQGGDPWLLLIEERRRWPEGLFGSVPSEALNTVLQAIDRAIKQDARFSAVRWLSREEYQSGCQGGADRPM